MISLDKSVLTIKNVTAEMIIGSELSDYPVISLYKSKGFIDSLEATEFNQMFLYTFDTYIQMSDSYFHDADS